MVPRAGVGADAGRDTGEDITGRVLAEAVALVAAAMKVLSLAAEVAVAEVAVAVAAVVAWVAVSVLSVGVGGADIGLRTGLGSALNAPGPGLGLARVPAPGERTE